MTKGISKLEINKGWFKKGIHPNNEFVKGHIPWNKNIKNIHLSSRTEFKSGRIAWNKGLKGYKKGKIVSEETKRKISLKLIGRKRENFRGKKHPNWVGGNKLYGKYFTQELKTKIRKRDKFTCKICKKNGHFIHHIDYNKKNNNKNNLITVCHSCHSKTNFNRKNWIQYFSVGKND